MVGSWFDCKVFVAIVIVFVVWLIADTAPILTIVSSFVLPDCCVVKKPPLVLVAT